jgi:hypothetical protein
MDHERTARIRALYEQIAKAHQQIEDEHGAAIEDADALGFSDGFTAGFAAGQDYAKAPKDAEAGTFLRGWFAGARFEQNHPHVSDIDADAAGRLVLRITGDRAETAGPAVEDTEPSSPAPTPRSETAQGRQPRTAEDLKPELYRAAAKALPEGTDHATIVLFAHLCEAIPDSPTH